ncbi:hypothetical protein CR203_00630 [Salipaludibacillus neizhouensis]|uniref:UPF0473 protein CR203_00630 n=1 Tax=Salipaludibacillus neizhouensis TaxID=885475 RepID=A0A3A9KGA0_9BACI|nr:DUF1292 domain-containing protein [Salipaludibacillus neizhouensis]RKL68593.1 hypothetical protein CR203_00630 [Salipaludibacillus neizhouensis]
MTDLNINHGSDEDRIIIPDENGDEHLFQVLFTFDVDASGNSYMVLAPEGSDENENDDDEVEVHAFRYEEPEGEELALFPIETDEEWEMVEELLNTFSEEEDGEEEEN